MMCQLYEGVMPGVRGVDDNDNDNTGVISGFLRDRKH